MSEVIFKAQARVLKELAGKIDDFYLVGGTALSQFYFHHRQSLDLDFFTQEFSRQRVVEIIELLKKATAKDAKLIGENLSKSKVEIMVYSLKLSQKDSLKLDFVRDVLPLINPTMVVNGIKILSLEDIYLRKIYAVGGAIAQTDQVGRKITIGGRQEAKDLFDIYFLSHTFMRLSEFATKFCDSTRGEGLIRWFRTFDRAEMKTDLADIKTDKLVEFRAIDKHLAGEIDAILKKEIGL